MAYTIARCRREGGIKHRWISKVNNVISASVFSFFPFHQGFLCVVVVGRHGVESDHRQLTCIISVSRPKRRAIFSCSRYTVLNRHTDWPGLSHVPIVIADSREATFRNHTRSMMSEEGAIF